MNFKHHLKLFDMNNELNSLKTSAGQIKLISLFIPIFIEGVLKSLMSTVNLYILGRYSDAAVAAVGVASQVVNLQLMIYTVVGIGASILISHYLGSGNKERARNISSVALVVVAFIGVFLGILMGFFSGRIMQVMRLKNELLNDSTMFFQIISFFSVFQAIIAVLSGICKSFGLAKISMITALVMNLFNAIGSYLVIIRPFEIPLFGVTGVAYARVVSEILALVIMLLLIIKMKSNNIEFKLKYFFPIPLRTIGDILRIGVPSGLDSLNYSISQMITTGIIASFGAVAVASKIYVQNIVFYVYIFGLSLGQSSSLLVGWLVGAGEYESAYKLNIRNLKITVFLNCSLSLIVYIFRYPILEIFTNNSEIIHLSAQILLIDVFVEIFRGYNHVAQNSLRGAGDVRFPVFVSFCTCWGLSITFSYILGLRLELGLIGCWISFGLDEMVRGNILLRRWRSKKWMSKAIVRSSSC